MAKQNIILNTINSNRSNLPNERKDAAENRQTILRVAHQLFLEQGVATVNMADIAKTANVGKGTLYRRFANKGVLCLSLLDDELRQFQDQTMQALRDMTADHQPILAQLDYTLDTLVSFLESNLDLMVEIDALRVPDVVQDINRPHFWQEMTIRGLLQKGISQGAFRADLDLHYLASALLAPLDARVYREHRVVQGYTTQQISAGLQSLVRGIAL